MIKVAKFGGSSLADGIQFRKVKDIIDSDKSRKFIVVSACGKKDDSEHKLTDLLYLCDAHLKYGVDPESIFYKIEDKFYSIRKDLDIKIDLETEFKEIRSSFSKHINTDYLVSRGEYLTAKCLAEYIDADFIDAADFLFFDYQGNVDLALSKEKLMARINEDRKAVIPGFYGVMSNGSIRVMSRGGSDISGSIIANIIDADIYENWTDVSGVYVADPRIIKHPLKCARVTYRELRGISYMGANVLHDDAIFPVKEKNIPINIRNTNDPENAGTLILDDCSELDKKDPPGLITGIAGKEGYIALTIVKSRSSTKIGFLSRLLGIFEEYQVSIESVPITVDTFSFIVAKEAVGNTLFEIIARIRKEVNPDVIEVDEDLALIAIVGRGMKAKPGISGSLLSEFGRNKINIKIINQSADELSIVVGVANDDFRKAIECIYDRFVLEERQ